MRKRIMAGNWKMNHLKQDAMEFFKELNLDFDQSKVECVIAGSSVLLPFLVHNATNLPVAVASQNVHWETSGAFTGEVSTSMLKDWEIDWCLIGHSERRQFFGETDETVAKRLKQALTDNMLPIACIGETLEERKAGKTTDVIAKQLAALPGIIKELQPEQQKNLVIAYEPVWAIGTGETATPEQAQEIHAFIRKFFADEVSQDFANQLRILYGGSVKPENVKELLSCADIDGGLVGGASLKADSFNQLVAAAAT